MADAPNSDSPKCRDAQTTPEWSEPDAATTVNAQLSDASSEAECKSACEAVAGERLAVFDTFSDPEAPIGAVTANRPVAASGREATKRLGGTIALVHMSEVAMREEGAQAELAAVLERGSLDEGARPPLKTRPLEFGKSEGGAKGLTSSSKDSVMFPETVNVSE